MAIKFNEENFEVNKTEGVATVTYSDDKAFMDGTEIANKDVKAVFDYANDYIEAGTNAAATKAETIMTEDTDINSVNVMLPYGVSKRGEIAVKAKREHTYPGMNGRPDVTKSTLTVAVKDPLTKMSKTKLKALEADMTSKLLS